MVSSHPHPMPPCPHRSEATTVTVGQMSARRAKRPLSPAGYGGSGRGPGPPPLPRAVEAVPVDAVPDDDDAMPDPAPPGGDEPGMPAPDANNNAPALVCPPGPPSNRSLSLARNAGSLWGPIAQTVKRTYKDSVAATVRDPRFRDVLMPASEYVGLESGCHSVSRDAARSHDPVRQLHLHRQVRALPLHRVGDPETIRGRCDGARGGTSAPRQERPPA